MITEVVKANEWNQKDAENQFLLSCVILKSSNDSFWRLQTWEKEGY
jgi:hypothetical protein